MGGVPSTPQNTGGGDDVFRGGVSHYEFRRGEIVSLGARGSYREKACRMMLVRCLLIGMELFDFWNKLLELPSSSRWPSDRVHQACELFDQNIQNFVMHSLLSFIGSTKVRYLLSGQSPGPRDANPFIDAAMSQEKSLVFLAVRRLLLNYIFRTPPNAKGYLYSDGDSPGILERVGFAAATFVLLPLNYLVNNSGDGSKHPLAECSLHVLLILTNYHKPVMSDESLTDKSDDSATSESVSKEHGNTFSKALANARDVEC
uniref:Dymeclin n=2 Tax=Brassica oleracea TaxID=3712 RepID=A0A0D3ART5_BRAOL